MSIESEEDLLGMTAAGHVTAAALAAMKAALVAGITTAELDAIGAAVFERHGARSAPHGSHAAHYEHTVMITDEAPVLLTAA